MKLRQIGKTDLHVSPITLGTMTFGSPVAFEDAVALVHYAVEQGINLIDTANMYEGYNRSAGSHGGVAEEIVGAAIAGIRDKVLVATKLGMKVGVAPEDEGTSAKAIETQLRRSLKRLNTDYIDLYYLHKPDPNVPMEEILFALQKEIKSGYIRHYGVSNYSAQQLQALLQTADCIGAPRPVICQPAMSLLKRDALETLLPLCQEQGIAITPYQVLQGGLLTGKYTRDTPPPHNSRLSEKPEWMWPFNDTLYDQLEKFACDAKSGGLTITQYAIRWALCQPAVATAIIGVKTTKQIDDAVIAAQ